MKVAIIGSGISGLAAAYYLHPRHAVTVFETERRIGGHTNTLRLDLEGRSYDVDTGFIVYNEVHYPRFTRLLRELGVRSRPTSMTFSVRHDPSGLEYGSASLGAFFAQPRNLVRPGFHRLLGEIRRFHREAPLLEGVRGDETTVLEYVEGHGYRAAFLEQYLVPLGASLWSAPPGAFERFPIRFVVDFMGNHNMLQLSGQPEWRVIEGGSGRYVEALAAGFRDRIHTGRGAVLIDRFADRVEVVDSAGGRERFDHVVLACHADQALRLLADPHALEREILGAFPYQPNDAVLHTDPGVLPRRRRAWSSWNYHLPAEDASRVRITYNMSILQGLDGPQVLCVTLNDAGDVSPERVVARLRYEHPVFTARRRRAQARHGELLGARRSSFCGAYWGYGFHEDGLRSGMAVARALGARRAA